MNPQATYNPQGASAPYLQGSSPQLQASPTSGLQVQNAYQPNLNQSGSGGVPISSGGGPAPAAPSGPSAAQQQAAATAAYNQQQLGQINGYYDSLQGNVNNQIGRLGTQQQVGDQNINDAYNTSFNTLQGQKAITDRNYNTTKGQTLQDYVSSRGDIQAGVGQEANALQQLLGSQGAGSSSAAQFAAPYAAARQGSLQNAQVGKTFGRNQQALDTNYGDYNNNFQTSLGDLAHQRDTQRNSLQASIDNNKSSLLGQLANISQQRAQAQPGATYQSIVAASQPYEQQINQLGSQVDQLGQQYAHPVVQTAAPVYHAPTLDSYTHDPTATPTLSSAPGAGDNLSPFLSVLLNQQDKSKQTNLAGQTAGSA